MRKRKLVKQIASIGLSLAMVMGSLSNVPMTAMAQDATETVVADEATNEIIAKSNETEVGNETYAQGGEIVNPTKEVVEGEIFNAKAEGYATGLTEEYFEELEARREAKDETASNEVAVTMETGSTSLPSVVDNTLPMGPNNRTYFPKIGNQRQIGSCWAWARVYYQMTYAMNRYHDREVAPENTMSPKYAYYMYEIGYTTYPDIHRALSIKDVPLTNFYSDVVFYDNPIAVCLNEDEELKAMSNRMIYIGVACDVQTIKKYLANGQILDYGSSYATWISKRVPGGYAHSGELIWASEIKGTGVGHALTIVGYDDNVACDLNADGYISADELGAFKIANSWGADWGNEGFVWVSYGAFSLDSDVVTNKERSLPEIMLGVYNGPNKVERAAVVTVEVSKVEDVCNELTISKDNSSFVVEGVFGGSNATSKLKGINYRGKIGECEATFVMELDLSGCEKYLTPEEFQEYLNGNWSVNFTEGDAVKLKNLYFADYIQNKNYGVYNKYNYQNYYRYMLDENIIVPSVTMLDVDYDVSKDVYNIKCSATDDKAGLTYRFYIEDNDGNKTELQGYSTNNKLSNIPVELFKNESQVCVDVKDCDGHYVTKRASVPMKNLYFTSSKAPEKTTETERVTFVADVVGGYDVEYQFVFKTSMDEKIIRDYSSDPTCTWVAEHSYYNPSIVVNARDGKTGEVVSKSMRFSVNRAPVISGCTITSGEMNLGESKQVLISFPANATGTGELKYVIEYSYNGGAKTVYYSSTNKTNVYWTPDKAGTYKLWLSLEDENGVRATREVTIKVVKGLSVDEFTVSAKSPVGIVDAVDFSVVASLGNGNYEYRFGTIFEGKEYEISNGYQSYSTRTNFRFSHLIDTGIGSAKAVGTHTLFVDVRDVDTGKVVRKTIENFEVKPLEVSSFTATPASPQKVGTTITLNVETKYEATYRGNAYIFYAIKDGVETQIEPYNPGVQYSVNWTPTEPGTYTLKYYVRDNYGQEATATMEYVVEDENANQTTIYYGNSWLQAYIHYKVGNGAWTTVPGVKMASDSSKIGYQWKYVIDMGDATSATVCFNNGNGTWDSKNGANYTVGVGTYGIKNNAINVIEDKLSVSLEADKAVGGTYTTTTFTAQASNGTEPYTYQFAMMEAGKIPTSSNYTAASTTNTYTHYPSMAGDYTLYVKVTDATGKMVESSKTYTVEGPKWTTFTATAADHKIGTPVTINAVIGNILYDKDNSYVFVIEKNGQVILTENTRYEGKLTWTPTEAGTYTIKAQYKVFLGAVYETEMTYEVVEDSINETTIYYSNASWSQAYIHYQVGNGTWTTAPGVKMSNNTSGNGYTWKYVIDLGSASNVTLCFNNGNGSWDSNNGSNYKLGVGTYGIKNNAINKLEDKLSVSLEADKAVGGTFTTTKFTATAVNGTAPYTYKLAIVKASVTPTDSNYFSISDTGVYNYTPYTEGNYTVYAKVTDANGKTAVTSMSYTIEGPKFKTFTATATDKKVGTPVTLTAEFVNVQYDRYNSYSFEVEKDGVVAEYYADSTGTYVWTPTEAGTYTITAKFTTYLGTVYEKEMTYEVSNGNTVTIYYNTSWSNANIHYCIAGGSWTAVPGVAMTKTSEKSGYTHKIVIDLGDATSVTACFNNGNGTWDSKNGSNYTISAGTYGVSNGSVYKLN